MNAIVMPTAVPASSAGETPPAWRGPMTLSHVLSATVSDTPRPFRQLMTRAVMTCQPASNGFELLEARPGIVDIVPSRFEHEFLVEDGSNWLHFRALAVPRTAPLLRA